MSATEMPTFAGASSLPVIDTDARFRLHEHVVRFLVAIRSIRSVAGDSAPDDPRLSRCDRVVAEAEPLHRAGREVMHEHIGALEQARADRSIGFFLQIERDASLGSIQPGEVRRRSIQRAIVRARRIAAVRSLHFDDVRPEVRELPRAKRCRNRLFEGYHSQSGERELAVLRHQEWTASGTKGPCIKNGVDKDKKG
jgi:hypothetical protein